MIDLPTFTLEIPNHTQLNTAVIVKLQVGPVLGAYELRTNFFILLRVIKRPILRPFEPLGAIVAFCLTWNAAAKTSPFILIISTILDTSHQNDFIFISTVQDMSKLRMLILGLL